MEGKLPPQSIELEEAVLGAVLQEKEAVITAMNTINHECFYKESHQKIFKVVEELYVKSEPIDLLTVMEGLKRKGELESIGGAYTLSQLTDKIASFANLEFHAMIIKEKHILRKLIKSSSEVLTDAYSETADLFDLISKATDALSSISSLTESNKSIGFQDHVNSIVKNVHEAKDSKELTGVATPFDRINTRTGGWQPTDLIILAARPAMGKTSFALQMATFPVFQNDEKVLFFSLEMSARQLTARVLAQELEINVNRFTRDAKYMDLKEMNSKLGEKEYIYTNNFIVDDRAGLDIGQLIVKAKTLHMKQKLGMIVIDYLQLLTDKSVRGNREQEISSISRKLKCLAKDLEIPVLALAQLSRAVEARGGDKKPILSDLRESGSIEQDADMVMFLHRPEYYGNLHDAEGNSMEGKASVITAKYRNGSTGEDILRFVAQHTRFCNLEDIIEEFTPIQPNAGFDEDAPF